MGVLDLQISAGADDVRHSSTDVITQAICAAGQSGGEIFGSAMRFIDVVVPAGAIFTVAYLTFTPDFTESGHTFSSSFWAHAADNSPQIITDANWHAIVDANLTATSVATGDLGTWTDDVEEQSPSLVSLFQEMVDNGYLDSEVAHIIWLDTGSTNGALRSAHQVEDSAAKATKLHLEWVAAGAVTLQPTGGLGDHVVY
ncbi:MAG: hypothetical protein V3W44_08605 [Dehalococcoidales bacterium]